MKIRNQVGLWIVTMACGLRAVHAGETLLAYGDCLLARTKIIVKTTAIVVQDEGKIGKNLHVNQDRVIACGFLGKIRAVECIPDLIKTVDRVQNWSSVSVAALPPTASFPAVSALIQIGKPASLASLDEIAKTDWVAAAKTLDTDIRQPQRHRVYLLTLVVSGVETPKVAEFMLKKRLGKAAASEKKPLLHALSIVQQQLKNNR